MVQDRIDVGPTAKYPTHHLSLTDGVTTLGLLLVDRNGKPTGLSLSETPTPPTVTRISQGASGYGDFEQPYTPYIQSDWSGGRGQEDFEGDTTRYTDGYRIDTRRNDLICGPKETRTISLTPATSTPYAATGTVGAGAMNYTACKIPLSNSKRTVRNVRLRLKGWNVSVAILNDDGTGKPNHSSAVGYGDLFFYSTGQFTDVDIPISAELLPNVQYWLQVYGTTGSGVTIASNEGNLPGNQIWSFRYSYALWLDNSAFYFVLEDRIGEARFFEYKDMLFAVTSPSNGSAPRLFANGYFGLVAQPDPFSITTSLTISDNLTGAICKIISGPGSAALTNYQKISGFVTGANAKMQFSKAWEIPITAESMFAVLGGNVWQEISGHGITKSVTSVLIADDTIYFAQGEGSPIRRGKLKPDATWEVWADDGANSASLLRLINDKSGKRKIWRTKSSAATVACSDVKPWGTNLTFGADTVAENTATKITGMIDYSQPVIPYVLKRTVSDRLTKGFGQRSPCMKCKRYGLSIMVYLLPSLGFTCFSLCWMA